MMGTPLAIRALDASDFSQLYYSFLESFQGYPVNMKMDKDAFKHRIIDKLNLRFDLSFVAFSGDKLVGFILHTTNTIGNSNFAYNGGTGVVPEYRGQGIIAELYRLAIPKIKQENVEAVLLEVLENNLSAIKVYEKLGFERKRFLRSYKRQSPPGKSTSIVRCHFESNADFTSLPGDDETKTDFMGSLGQLQHNRKNEKLLKVLDEDFGHIISYLILNPKTGRIARLWVEKSNRRRGLGRAMIEKAQHFTPEKNLTIINVDSEDADTHRFLLACGFENQLNQFEMALDLTQIAG